MPGYFSSEKMYAELRLKSGFSLWGIKYRHTCILLMKLNARTSSRPAIWSYARGLTLRHQAFHLFAKQLPRLKSAPESITMRVLALSTITDVAGAGLWHWGSCTVQSQPINIFREVPVPKKWLYRHLIPRQGIIIFYNSFILNWAAYFFICRNLRGLGEIYIGVCNAHSTYPELLIIEPES